MQLFDPDRMAEAKEKASKRIRWSLRWYALAAIIAAYWIGYESGTVAAISKSCAALLH